VKFSVFICSLKVKVRKTLPTNWAYLFEPWSIIWMNPKKTTYQDLHNSFGVTAFLAAFELGAGIAIGCVIADVTQNRALGAADFLGRLTSLIPPPRKNMIRYHGVFAPNSALRAQIVPKPEQETLEEQESTEGNSCPGQGKRWAQLLSRVFGIDVLACPGCESRMQMISFITESKAIRDILASLKMATAPPEAAPACRSERQAEFSWG
jgi:hypothetical protein